MEFASSVSILELFTYSISFSYLLSINKLLLLSNENNELAEVSNGNPLFLLWKVPSASAMRGSIIIG